MAHVFISHVEEDERLALALARGIESAGYSCWYYERDNLPGQSYLLQVGRAIDDAEVMIVVVSPHSLSSAQVTSEVVRAHESGKSFMPVLFRLTHLEFQEQQPVWRQAFGAATTLRIPASADTTTVLPSILLGLDAMVRGQKTAPPVRPASDPVESSGQETRRSGRFSVLATKPGRRAALTLFALVGAAAIAAAVLILSSSGDTSGSASGASGGRSASSASILHAPNSGALVFAAVDGEGAQAQVHAINLDGTGSAVLLRNALFESDPKWSPDGKRMVFTSRSAGNRDIFILGVNSDQPLQLTNHVADDLEPTWSPDGALIAFTSLRDGNRNIYVMNPAGSIQARLTDDPADDFHPAWSPDGTRIVFTSMRDGNREIYVMAADGSNQRRLTDHTQNDDQPAWSPDSKKVAFVSRRDGNREVYVIDLDGTGLRRLTNDQAEDFQPAWSPEGGHIAFVSTRDGHREIYLTRSDSTGLRRLTYGTTDKDQPSWSR